MDQPPGCPGSPCPARGSYSRTTTRASSTKRERTLEIARRTLGPEHAHTLYFMNSLAVTYEEQGRLEEAERTFAEAATVAERSMPEGHWYRGMFLCGHGRALATLGRYDEAESAFREGYEILEAALGAEHDRSIKAIRSLADLYDAWGKPEIAAEWRAKLDQESDEAIPIESRQAP